MADALPLTVLVPETTGASIDVFVEHAALKLAVVDRAGAHLLGAEWDAPGMYLLLDRHADDGTWGAYVGKAPAGIKSRLGSHLRTKDHWYRALLIRRDTTQGFNSAQVGWLEGRLYEMLALADDAVLHNGNRPGDETLPPYDRQMLELVVLPVTRVLRMIGHDPATPDDQSPKPRSRKSSTTYGVTLAQLVDAGLIAADAELISTNGAWPAQAAVVGGNAIKMGSVTYDTPSAAACAVKGGAANGWEFWGVVTSEGPVKLAVLRARILEVQSVDDVISTPPAATPH